MLTFFSNIAEILAGLIKAGKWPVVGAFIMLVGFGGTAIWGKGYVDEKHDDVKHQIEENDKQAQRMIATLTVMQGTLSALTDTVKDVKDAVKTSDQTARDTQKMVIDIYRNNRDR